MYFQGFVVPVPTDKREPYRAMAATAAAVFAEHGALRTVEAWSEDVPHGKLTDLWRAVDAQDGESLAYSWIEWPDRATCDAASPRIMADERMKPGDDLPFNPARMIYAGFERVYDGGDGGVVGYVDGMVAPAPADGRDAFARFAETVDTFFLRHGALRVVDGWGADVPDGKVTDFKRAVAAEAGEQVVFGWVEWPDKATRNAAFAAMEGDEAMRALPPATDMKRAIFGGFTPILDTDQQGE